MSALRELQRLIAPKQAPSTGIVLSTGENSVTAATAAGVRTYARPAGAALMPADRVRVSGGAILGRLVSQSETYAE